MIEGYLQDREPLTMVMTLVDGEIGPTKLDAAMLSWLRSHRLPHTVVATKHDKVKSSRNGSAASETSPPRANWSAPTWSGSAPSPEWGSTVSGT